MKFKVLLLIGLLFLVTVNSACVYAATGPHDIEPASAASQTETQDSQSPHLSSSELFQWPFSKDVASIEYSLISPAEKRNICGFVLASDLPGAVDYLTLPLSPIPAFIGCQTEKQLEQTRKMLIFAITSVGFHVGARLQIIIVRESDGVFRVTPRTPAANEPHPIQMMRD